jgi:cytochrome P450
MRPLIQSLVDRMLDAAEQRGRMDIIADLAYPLPTAVIAALLGVPENDRDQFKRWSNDLATTFDTDPARPQRTVAAYDGVLALLDYMAELVSRRRQEPHDDLTQALIAASDTEGGLSAEAVVANTALLLFAGHETTTNLIGNGMHALLHHPDQLQRLLADPELIASAVEELLRFDSPVQGTGRQAKEDLDIGGRRIGAGQMLLLYIGAANRDPAQFDDPDRLDLARAENRHLTFSYGPHFCLGAALARLEGQIAVGTLLRRWPGLRLTSESARWRDNFLLRGLMELPVVF